MSLKTKKAPEGMEDQEVLDTNRTNLIDLAEQMNAKFEGAPAGKGNYMPDLLLAMDLIKKGKFLEANWFLLSLASDVEAMKKVMEDLQESLAAVCVMESAANQGISLKNPDTSETTKKEFVAGLKDDVKQAGEDLHEILKGESDTLNVPAETMEKLKDQHDIVTRLMVEQTAEITGGGKRGVGSLELSDAAKEAIEAAGLPEGAAFSLPLPEGFDKQEVIDMIEKMTGLKIAASMVTEDGEIVEPLEAGSNLEDEDDGVIYREIKVN